MDEKLLGALRRHAHPLRTVHDDGAFEDLGFLRQALRGARIVGLGEGSHGTREHFLLKNRLIRFLVEEMHFNTFVIEAAYDACDVINDYVLYGRGDKRAALAGQHFWTWDTEEVMELIDWMRGHNRTCEKGGECRFLGFDMQSCDVACARLLREAAPLAGADEPAVRATVESCQSPQGGDPERALWLLGYLVHNEIPLTRKAGPERYAQLLRAARLLAQNAEHGAHGGTNASRDRFMAENVIRLVHSLPRESRLVLWAHNGHISNGGQWKTIGEHLREHFGSLYYAVGFTLGGGRFQSRLFDREKGTIGALQPFDVPPIGPNLWEHDLAQVSDGDYIIDLRGAMAREPDIARWALQTRELLMLDEAYDPVHGQGHYEIPGAIGQWFDGLVYTAHTTSARPNPTGLRRDERSVSHE